MLKLSQVDQSPEPIALGDRAKEDLRFIRRTMERGAAFTAVPGWGGVGMGLTALAAAVLASRQPTAEGWLLVWILEALLAVAIGAVAIHRKARRADLPVFSGAGRKFILSFLPPSLAGGVLTVALWQAGSRLTSSGGMASPLRRRRGHGRHLFGQDRPRDGDLFHGPRSVCASREPCRR